MKGYTARFDRTEKLQSSAPGILQSNALKATAGKSAARWSIHSERTEGVGEEPFCLIDDVDSYATSVSNAGGPIMRAIQEKMEQTDWDALHKQDKTLFSHEPEMSTDPSEAQSITMFTSMKGAKRVLKIGMSTGYSAAAIVEALPSGGECVSLDVDPFSKKWVGDAMIQFSAGKKHSVIVGPALDSMAKLPVGKKFDFVFVDANKSEYQRYAEMLLERDLLSDDAMIAVDNTLYRGVPYMPAENDQQPKTRCFGDDARGFNVWIANHPKLMTVMLPFWLFNVLSHLLGEAFCAVACGSAL